MSKRGCFGDSRRIDRRRDCPGDGYFFQTEPWFSNSHPGIPALQHVQLSLQLRNVGWDSRRQTALVHIDSFDGVFLGWRHPPGVITV